MCCEPFDQVGEVVAGEVPLERLGDLVPVVFELVEGACELGKVLEVVRFEQLALDDREVDLGLVEPACVDGQVAEAEVRPATLEARDRALAAVGGAVVDDPEDAPGGGVGLLGHHLPDEPVERFDLALGLGASGHPRASSSPTADVERGQVGESAPLRSYVCSTRCPREPGAGGSVAWMRARAWIEGFSSAQITNSPGCSSFPSQRPW